MKAQLPMGIRLAIASVLVGFAGAWSLSLLEGDLVNIGKFAIGIAAVGALIAAVLVMMEGGSYTGDV